MLNRLVYILLMAAGLMSCNTKQSQYPLEDYRFADIFGQRRDDSTGGIYSLQCSDWRSARYRTDSMVLLWTNMHPDAMVLEVCSFKSADAATGKELSNTYCWLVSKEDTINTWLVRNGCCKASSMLWADGFDKFLASGYDKSQKVETKVNITEPAYHTFRSQLKSAEAYAQSGRLGIWSLPDSLR